MQLKLVFSFLITLGFINVFDISVNAQNANFNEQEPFQQNEQNPLYGGSNFNPMDLIHNANFFNSRSGADFAEDTNKNIDSAADDFKKQQLQKLIEMNQQQDQNVTENSQEQ